MRLRRQRWSLVSAMARLVAAQQTLIHDHQAQLEQAARDLAELQCLVLEERRVTRDVAVGARLASEHGFDINEDLDLLIRDLSDSIANMEEHMLVIG